MTTEAKGKEPDQGDAGNDDRGVGTRHPIPILNELEGKSETAMRKAIGALRTSLEWERKMITAVREAIIAFRDRVVSRVQYLSGRVVSHQIETQFLKWYHDSARERNQCLNEIIDEHQKIKDMCDENSRDVISAIELATAEYGTHEVPPQRENISEATAQHVAPDIPSPPLEGPLAKAWVQRLTSTADLAETMLIGIREIKMSAANAIEELRMELDISRE